MKKRTRYPTVIAVLLALTLMIQPLCTPPMLDLFLGGNRPSVHAAPPTQDAANNAIYLPAIMNNASPGEQGGDAPDFVINSPINGTSVGGVTFFAIQPTTSGLIDRVTFRAGSTDLGTDTTAGDGFRVFLNARNLPAGAAQLTATASGPGGETTKSINVTLVPNPPQSATIGADGGVLASEIGSVISLLPGSVPAGTTVTVDELTQAETTTRHGIDWESMGVTFLGAQDVQASAPISGPFGMVASAGFGNRVQPGQAVVNYRIAPDADGDGADEIVVVNTASVAPNGDVIADPVLVPIIYESSQSMKSITGAGIGEVVAFSVSGFNVFSLSGRVAEVKSIVNNETIEVPLFVSPNSDGSIRQTAYFQIPNLAHGTAIVIFKDLSTKYTSNPVSINILPSPNLVDLPEKIINDAINALESRVDEIYLQAEDAGFSLAISQQRLESDIANLKALLNELSENPSTENTLLLKNLALLIQSVNFLELLPPPSTLEISSAEFTSWSKDNWRDLANGLGLLGAGLWAFGIPFWLSAGGFAMTFAAGAIFLGLAFDLLPPGDSGGSGTTGMGAAPPPGGNGGGNAGGSGGSKITLANVQQTSPVMVKIFSNGSPTPFTGMTDPGGYFFVPFIPQDEPFTAVAIDTVTGQTRKFKGIGPKFGESVYMFFDFFNEAAPDITVTSLENSGAGSLRQAVADAQVGDQIGFTISGTITLNTPIVISKTLEIVGPGIDKLMISGNNVTGIFSITKDNTVTISNLTLTQGRAENGGAIFNQGDLTVADSKIVQNTATENGGGIYTDLKGKSLLRNSSVISNTAENGMGGGIFSCCRGFDNGYTTLLIYDSNVRGNIANLQGGGIYVGPAAENFEVQNSLITKNSVTDPSGDGGGILIRQIRRAMIKESQITGNRAHLGGGIASGETVTLVDSTVSNNYATGSGGGLASHGPGALGVVAINSTISNNTAANGNGGGIYEAIELELLNSTVVSNIASGSGGGIYTLWDMTIQFSTIVSNTAGTRGGAIRGQSDKDTFKANIIAGNTAPTDPGYSSSRGHNPISLGFNIINNGTDSGFVDGQNNDQVGIDPLLGFFATHGGKTATVSLQPGSPAIDKIPTAACTDTKGQAVSNDQRGVSRPQGVGCDTGALETP